MRQASNDKCAQATRNNEIIKDDPVTASIPLHKNTAILDYLESRMFSGFVVKVHKDKLVLETSDTTLIDVLFYSKLIKNNEDEFFSVDVTTLLSKRSMIKKIARDRRLQYESEVNDLGDALNSIHAFSDPAVKERLNEGYACYSDIPVLFPRGTEVVTMTPSGMLGGQIESCNEVSSMFGMFFSVVISVMLPTSQGTKIGNATYKIPNFDNKVLISKLPIRPIVEKEKVALTERGKKFRDFTREPIAASYVGNLTIPTWMRDYIICADGRVMVDSVNFAQIDSDFYYEMMRQFNIDNDDNGTSEETTVVSDDNLWRCYPRVHGFSMRLKRWGWIDVEHLSQVKWRDDAFSQLVLEPKTKQTVLQLVKHYGNSFTDFIEGKSGGLVFLLHGPSGTGKAQPLDCMVQTPNGPVRMGDMKTGDFVLTPDGGKAKILGVYPQGVRPCYELTFADGRKTKADADHLWKAKTDYGRINRTLGINNDWDIVTTKRLKEKTNRIAKSRIPLTNPIQNETKNLPIDPWLLGILLGDGFYKYRQINVSTADEYIVNNVKELLPKNCDMKYRSGYDYAIIMSEESKKDITLCREGIVYHAMRQKLTELNLYGLGSHERFIPEIYMNSDIDQKIQLICGLMDSDGYVGKEGNLSYATSSERLSTDFQKLIWSLGGIASIHEKETGYYSEQRNRFVECKNCYNVQLRVKNPSHFVSLPRKKNRVGETNQYSETLGLRIEKIERIEDQPTQCILIDHPDHLYLTDDYIVTHNTLTSEAIADTLHRPLYSVSVGELGVSPEELESKLRKILDLAFQWNAVLLLDEADIFMEARDTNNIERNAMVSIFLRLLEYYSGVMFLTTNRVKSFDQAFFSRISIAISYPVLGKEDRKNVWQNVLSSAGIDYSGFDMDALAKHNVNGRNIKTAVRIAQTMATGDNRPVRQDDFEANLAMAEQFMEDVKK